MTTLSQSELLALSSSNLHLSTNGDPITPAIDLSIFNESAGSRKQTYSRPSPHHHHHRHRLAGLLPKHPASSNNLSFPSSSADPDRLENHSIITSLKNLLSSHPEFREAEYLLEFNSFAHFNNPIDFSVPAPVHVSMEAVGLERKRKRGRKPRKFIKLVGPEDSLGLEILNKNGVRVDLAKLGSFQEDPYKEELRRRTQGLEKEEELLEFFRQLDGQWCSRRKRRRIVDASQFGDVLPLGWKLLLGLKRKDGCAWVYCRRYIRLLLIYLLNSFVLVPLISFFI